MNDIPLSLLFALLVFLVILSGFFSGSETALMTLNRYRLRHLARSGHTAAQRAQRLLKRPDRLIGLILLGNNFVNILASSVATVIALRLIGEAGVALAAGLLTLVILIFAEVTPKTLAALHPERLAFPATLVLEFLLRLLYPLVWLVNIFVNQLLRLFGVSPGEATRDALSHEELRTVVAEAGAIIPRRHQEMLLSIFDLETVSVEDIMVPRAEIVGIDLDDDWSDIVEQLRASQHTRLPVYQGNIDNIQGFIHLRRVMKHINQLEPNMDAFKQAVREPYFFPVSTPLNTQLVNFQREKRRIGLAVNEYGDIQGLVTLEDILEEIVGEFTTDPATSIAEVHPNPDGSFVVEGTASIRNLNRLMHWELPTDGPKTFNGLILEHMEAIPEPGTSLLIAGYPIEIMQVAENSVKSARIYPDKRKNQQNA